MTRVTGPAPANGSGDANADPAETKGLELSRRLFEEHGRALLRQLDVVDVCSVACVGGTSQNAGMDDMVSRDHFWGPYLTFMLPREAWRQHSQRFREALKHMPDRVDGASWRGYDGPDPRKTDVAEMVGFLFELTGYREPPARAADWLPHLTQRGFLGRRWTERLFDAGQGQVFHDPCNQFTDLWQHYVRYPPPDIQKALLARGLFRTWNAGPEYNLARALQRGDALAFSQCRSRFVNEVIELAFCWNESYVPAFKWRAAHFRRLPDCPVAVREGIAELALVQPNAKALTAAADVVQAVKRVIRDRFQLSAAADEPLSAYAHEIRARIGDRAIRDATSLDW